MGRSDFFFLGLAILGLLILGCAQPTAEKEKVNWTKNFETSLHYTRQGKITFYSAENGGIELLTNKPITSFNCIKCHAETKANGQKIETASYVPDCYDCHVTPGDKVNDSICLGCHARQRTEIAVLKLSDVHRDRGMGCMDCHSKEDIMGDGKRYRTLVGRDTAVKCESCHEFKSNPAHILHGDRVHCTACHQSTVISCYNCHLNSAEEHQKRTFRPIAGFQVLINFKGKVYPANYMTAVYDNKTFVTFQPFYTHAIQKNAKDCKDCHGNANIKAYLDTGKIVMTRWNESSKSLSSIQGVVPLPPDWRSAMYFEYLTYVGNPSNPVKPEPWNWTYVKNSSDLMQMCCAEPLTKEQIEKLAKEFKLS
ncbi:MAG: hypothetical protein QXO16_07530 [Archaeoglobaceae archaeon]